MQKVVQNVWCCSEQSFHRAVATQFFQGLSDASEGSDRCEAWGSVACQVASMRCLHDDHRDTAPFLALLVPRQTSAAAITQWRGPEKRARSVNIIALSVLNATDDGGDHCGQERVHMHAKDVLSSGVVLPCGEQPNGASCSSHRDPSCANRVPQTA